ncbi:uncharacterized protein [Argopecten irradians]|uniref:uncharacterized protein n=1 Tax=Argopecten irradians TaxID=31199 RepID=UPI003724ABA5
MVILIVTLLAVLLYTEKYLNERYIYNLHRYIYCLGIVSHSLAGRNSLIRQHCDDVSSLALVYDLNEISVQYSSFEKVNQLLRINSNDNLSRDDFLIWLDDKCRSRSLTLEWLLKQTDRVCPNTHKIRSLIEPSGVICHQNGNVTQLTKKALMSFVNINKSYECETALTSIQSQCEIDALFNIGVPMVTEQTLGKQIDAKTRRTMAAIRCTLPRLRYISPGCGSLGDIQIYRLITELLQKQPFKLRGEVDFETITEFISSV